MLKIIAAIYRCNEEIYLKKHDKLSNFDILNQYKDLFIFKTNLDDYLSELEDQLKRRNIGFLNYDEIQIKDGECREPNCDHCDYNYICYLKEILEKYDIKNNNFSC
jgi:hypothetical protein